MFEEGEWGPEATTPAAPRPALLAPRPGPPAGNSREHRRRLRAVLRRLAGLASAPDAAASSPGQERGQQAGSGAEGRRRGRRRGRPPPATTAAREEGPGAITTAAGPPSPSPSLSRGGAAAAAVVGGPGLAGARVLPSSRPGAAAAAPVGSQQGSPPAATERRRPDGPLLTRQQWRNRQKNRRRPKNKFKVAGAGGEGAASGGGGGGGGPSPEKRASSPAEAADPSAAPSAGLPGGGGARASSLTRLRLEQRLDSARFRYLNQQLYTCSSQEAARLSREDPEALAAYHRGFARQVARWPERPVERFVRYLRNRPASLVVADFGCGDCTLARSLRNRVHCFDLVALDPRVTVCDMAQVPLGTESVDVAVFCLALLGTNLHEILEEAHRVLCLGGTLLVAEVASRFVEVRAFVGAMAQLGFRLLSKDASGSHFYAFEFRKVGPAPSRGSPGKPLPGLALRPCLYKRR